MYITSLSLSLSLFHPKRLLFFFISELNLAKAGAKAIDPRLTKEWTHNQQAKIS